MTAPVIGDWDVEPLDGRDHDVAKAEAKRVARRGRGLTLLEATREQLMIERQRGVPFEQAWPRVTEAALGLLDAAYERNAWWQALAATVGGWGAAYNCRPHRSARAVGLLLDALD